MENKLQVFPYEGKEIRTVFIENEPWWVLKDVCDVLGLSDTNKAAARLDDDELTRIKFVSGGQSREMYVINEFGLYNVILLSRKPEARKFKRFVTHEILPSIRKYGLYATQELLNNPDLLLNVLLQLKEERTKTAALLEQTLAQEQQIIEMRPKAGYYDVVLSCKDAVPISIISKDYGWSAQKMNAFLHDCGVQYKQGTIWLLYQKYAENGYTDTKTHIYKRSNGEPRPEVRTQWTQKGRLFIYEIMRSNGYLPLIERQ